MRDGTHALEIKMNNVCPDPRCESENICNYCCVCYNPFPRASPWVKTSERLPEDQEKVLFIELNIDHFWGYPIRSGTFWEDRKIFIDIEDVPFYEVTHWMPAPKLPGEK